VALGLTHPLTEMSTKNTSQEGQGGWCVLLTTLPPSHAKCLVIWEPQPPGTLRAYPGLQWDCFTFFYLLREVGDRSSLWNVSFNKPRWQCPEHLSSLL